MKRRFLAIVIGTVVMITSNVTAQTEHYVFSEGNIKLKGSAEGVVRNEKISFVVTKAEFDWLAENEWTSQNKEEIVFSDEVQTESERGVWELKFFAEDSGIYNIYVGAAGNAGEAEKKILKFVNSQKNKEAIEIILSEDGDIKELLEKKLWDLGVFEECFKDADKEKAAEIIKESVKDKESLTYEEAMDIVRCSMVAALLNENRVGDIGDFMFCFEDLECSKLYEDEFSHKMTDMLSVKDYKTSEEVKETVAKTIVLMQVNKKDGAGKIKEVLRANAKLLGIKENKITTVLCEKIMDEDEFESVEELVDFAEDFDEPTKPTGGGSSGGGGSINKTNTSKNNAYSGMVVNTGELTSSQQNVEMSIFDDIENVSWAKEAIMGLYKQGVIDGKLPRMFVPNDKVKREEFAKMLTLAFKLNLKPEEYTFEDVGENDWCYQYVRTAKAAGITNGVSDTVFGKGQNITRQDLCAMIYRGLQALNYEGQGVNLIFTDSEQISEYAKEAIGVLVSEGVLSGYEDNSFKPYGEATRAEAAKIIYGAAMLLK